MADRYLITGAAGQDGLLLSRRLTQAGHDVIGLVRTGEQADRLMAFAPEASPVRGDLADTLRLSQLIQQIGPTRLVNLGAITSVPGCNAAPVSCHQVNVEAVRSILEAVRRLPHECRILQASSGLIYEGTAVSPQDETTQRHPLSLYARTKAEAMDLIAHDRERYGMHASCAILYNHESPLRSPDFVTRRVTQSVARIALGLQSSLSMGNVQARRDWGWAPEYAEAMLLMLDHDDPADIVIGTGITHSVMDLLTMTFNAAGLGSWRDYVSIDTSLIRDPEATVLAGNSNLARKTLGWTPTTSLESIMLEMLNHDLRQVRMPSARWYPA